MTSQLLILSFAAKNLHLHWVRSLLAVIGIVIGVLAIGYTGVIQNVQLLHFADQWKAYDTFVISPDYDYYQKHGLDTVISEKQLNQIRQAAADNYVIPTYSTYGSLGDFQIKRKNDGLSPAVLGIRSSDLLMITELDSGTTPRSSSEVIVGGGTASDKKITIGTMITIIKKVKRVNQDTGLEETETDEYPMRVVGILKKNERWDLMTDNFFIPYEPWFRGLINFTGYEQVMIKLKNVSEMNQTITAIGKELNNRNTVVQINDFNVFRNAALSDMQQTAATTTAIAGISLIVAGVSIFNVMVMSVIERYREIGVLRSIGTMRFTILTMFIYESILLGVIGSAIGGTLALAGSYLQVSMQGELNYFFIPQTLIQVPYAMCFGILISLFSGLYPAWKASRLHPIEALRYE